VTAEEQRGAAMRAELFEQTDAAFRVAERHQVLAEQLYADRRAVRLGQLPGKQRRDPVTPDGVAHRRARADASDELVLFVGQHGVVLPALRSTAQRPRRAWPISLRPPGPCPARRLPLPGPPDPGQCPVMPKSVGVPVSLVRIATRDGVWLDGAVAEPRGRRRAALVWVHGLGSVFSSG